jgi:hypothetical protein
VSLVAAKKPAFKNALKFTASQSMGVKMDTINITSITASTGRMLLAGKGQTLCTDSMGVGVG